MTDRTAIALTLYGEARGEGTQGLIAVACVIYNRHKRLALSYEAVCLATRQFSCWNEDDPNYPHLKALSVGELPTDAPILHQCYTLADVMLAEGLIDHMISTDVTHYFARTIPAPSWAKHATAVAEIGRHIFLSGVDRV